MNKMRQGQAPFGFRWEGGKLHRHPDEAAVRKLAFELFLTIQTMGGVARELNRLGKFTRRGGAWSDMQVSRILACPSAIGRYELRKSGKAPTPGEAGIVECEPIVSREIWEAVAAILAKRKIAAEEPESPTLSGLVFCACGMPMRWETASQGFACAKCRHAISLDELIRVFAADFQDVLVAHPILATAICGPLEMRPVAAELQKLETEQQQCEHDISGIERMFLEKAIGKPRFEELHRPLVAKADQLAKRVKALEHDLQNRNSPDRADWLPVWDSWPSDKKLTFINSVVAKFEIGLDEVNISYLLPEPPAPKEAPPAQQISSPTNQPASGGPVYVRLPKPSQQCPITGLSRAKLNELILPSERNNFRPPVASKSLRKAGQQKGVRLILLESLLAYLAEKA